MTAVLFWKQSMAIFYNTDNLPDFENPVLTIGTFDGVHEGHKAILEEVVKHAGQVAGESIVITFEPHPRKLLFPTQSLRLITPLQEKLRLIAETGIKHIVVVSFTREFSHFSAEDYVTNFLVLKFQPKHIIIGYDHHFGHDRTGNISLLRKMRPAHGYDVFEIPAQLIDEAAVSSTKIRKALLDGQVADAAHMLGRHYTLKGKVISGKQLGRKLGYPTANLQPEDADQLIPANGIYAVRVRWNDKMYGGMMSVGFNPTLTTDKQLHLEVNIFDFQHSIYQEIIEVTFIDWLRSEEKFDSLDALTVQLAKDKQAALQVLSLHQ